ncbi:hypothetical protein BDK51DRAFT_44091 [Blyttiomyces helicus]|uniref:Uncharacterized protein n=1 Tax=Blyttiomyces helicus TaxID=388810 RepID=A0A4P9WJY1_9FUNG|nr:hypothetical protein BDK51DRAFT_44091 [Blyttiomyces helicus]|eukprot:RKO93269.1 hypothetical protein BDK51DRAFT_44091 [Blyttiomyces helicus]
MHPTKYEPLLGPDPCPAFQLPVLLNCSNSGRASTTALQDSGALASFIDNVFATKRYLQIIKKIHPVLIEAVRGRVIPSKAISHVTRRTMVIVEGHSSFVTINILSCPSNSVSLGTPKATSEQPRRLGKSPQCQSAADKAVRDNESVAPGVDEDADKLAVEASRNNEGLYNDWIDGVLTEAVNECSSTKLM